MNPGIHEDSVAGDLGGTGKPGLNFLSPPGVLSLERSTMHDLTGRGSEAGSSLGPAGGNGGEARSYPRRVLVKSRGAIVLVNVDHIRWIGAEGAYVSLHTTEETHMLRMSIGKFEEFLPPEKFARIHRSAIVNLDSVTRMLVLRYGKCAVVLDDNTRLVMSRSCRNGLLRRFVTLGEKG
jgi:DNA-binding LytR/AlgR family response regulator